MYRLRILDAATRDLERLDKSVARRVVKRLNWLTKNLDNINPEALKGDLVGLYKFRVGNYRVLYEIFHDEQAIVIHQIGHRREVYRRR